MTLDIREDRLESHINLIQKYINRAIMKVPGYAINELSLTIPSDDISINEFLSLGPIAAGYDDYPVWLEIPKALDDYNIPSKFSFSTYEDVDGELNPITVQRKVSDMSISSSGVANNIRYLNGITSNLTKNDINEIFLNTDVTPLSTAERAALVADPNGEYYVEEPV
jgi:hypothetical protein